MKIDIKTDGSASGAELHHFAGCCASFELGTFRNQIGTVQIRLFNEKEAPGGQGTSCAVQVDFSEGDSVVGEAEDSNPYVAIHWALERAGWSISSRQQTEVASVSNLPGTDRQLVFEGAPNRAA